jgi:hypothetical protein
MNWRNGLSGRVSGLQEQSSNSSLTKKKKPIKQHKKDQQQKPTESMHVFLLAALPLFCLFVRLFAPHTHCLLNKATRIQSWDFS